MKKMALILVLILTLTGCKNEQVVHEASKKSVRFAGIQGSVTIVTDNETGCKYLREQYGSGNSAAIGLTVLLKPDGTPDCD